MAKKRYSGAGGNGVGRNSRRIKRKARGGPRNLDYLKPKKFKDYMTSGEVALAIPVDPRWLKRLEEAGRIPAAQRVPMGSLEIRLWSPQQVEEIRTIIEGHKVGRPQGS